MARKVFISVLGTGFYRECVYQRDGFKSSATRFIQQATLEMLMQGGGWTEADHGYVLLTQGARDVNWHIPSGVRENTITKVDEPYMGLECVIEGMHLPFEISGIDIPMGKSEEEIWQIFNTVYSVLQEDDQLYFDLTHGFRYLPMLVLVLGNYAKFLKHVKVCGITYGNFETRTQGNVAPIIDITSFSTLQDWTAASADYLRHGDSTQLSSCGVQQLTPILKETKGKDEAAQNLRRLMASLNTYTDDMRFCRGMALIGGKPAADVIGYIDQVGDQYLEPFLPLLAKVRDTVAGMSINHAANMIVASAQCYRYGNLQAAITLLEEGVVSFFCERHGLRIDDMSQRKIVNNALNKRLLCVLGRQDEYVPLSEEGERSVADVEQDPLLTDDIITAFANLCDIRNDVNHAGMRSHKQPLKVKRIGDNLQKTLGTFMQLLDDSKGVGKESSLPPLFINLSNHPSKNWTDEQMAASKAFGEVKDISFPQVSPQATTSEIASMAEQLVAMVWPYTTSHTVTVHVMGEMGLTCCVVRRLLARGIRCVCSTSQRIVQEEADGRRVAYFHFSQFRDYAV